MTLVKITNDLFDISARLKSVKSTYEVYYNAHKQRYEVHDEAQRGNTLAFVVPYDELDARTVDYALKTDVSHALQLFEEIERANARADKDAQDKQINKALENYEERRFYDSNRNN